MKGVKGEEIILTTSNAVGQLALVSAAIKEANVNIRALAAWVEGDSAVFRLVTSDHATTKEVLASVGTLESEQVVIVEMPDEIGQLGVLGEKLNKAGVDLTRIYGTTSEPGKSAIVVFSSSDNDKALEALAV